MSKYHLAILAQVFNLIGTAIIFFALSFTSTGLRVVHEGKNTILCLDKMAFVANGLLSSFACPAGDTNEVALMNSDHPRLAIMGLGIIVAASMLALTTIQKPKK
jgi:hypothetical protein